MVTKYKKEHPGEKTIKIFRPHEKDCVWFHFQTWFFTFIKKLIDNFHILGVISYFSTGFHTRLQLILTRFIHIINYINLRLFFFFSFSGVSFLSLSSLPRFIHSLSVKSLFWKKKTSPWSKQTCQVTHDHKTQKETI